MTIITGKDIRTGAEKILDRMRDSEYEFFLTGSRYFGDPNFETWWKQYK